MNLGLASAFSLLALAVVPAAAAELPAPDELLAAAIARHDPEGAWASGAFRLVVRESRPDGSDRDTTLLIDNRSGRFETASRRDGDMIIGSLGGGSLGGSLDGSSGPEGCVWLVNGSTRFPDELRDRYRLTCERLEWIRNYYVYLWGLPMKLRDPGTRLGDAVVAKEFEGRTALELQVTYDESVGSDVWYFYFDPGSHELVGYRFYHDEAKGDGEYIVLDGLREGAGLRLPRSRAWYTHQGDKHLGTDTLLSIEEIR